MSYNTKIIDEQGARIVPFREAKSLTGAATLYQKIWRWATLGIYNRRTKKRVTLEHCQYMGSLVTTDLAYKRFQKATGE